MTSKWLATAIETIMHGDLTHGRGLLRAYVARHPQDTEGWYWLSRVTENVAEHIDCLRQLTALQAAPASPERHIAEARIMTPFAVDLKAKRPQSATRRLVVWAAFAFAGAVLVLMAAAVAPMLMGYRTVVILSGSMQPTIPTGAAVIVEPVPAGSLQVGDVIAFSPTPDAPMPTVHRIANIAEKGGVRHYITRGDANESDDVGEVTLSATAWRMWYHVPLAGYLISFAASSTGALALVIAPLALLGVLKVADWLGKLRVGQMPRPRLNDRLLLDRG